MQGVERIIHVFYFWIRGLGACIVLSDGVWEADIGLYARQAFLLRLCNDIDTNP